MTVATSTSKSGPYAGAGTTGPFTVGFRFLATDHLQVVQADEDGVETVLVLDTDYTVAGVGAGSGSVTLAVALPVGETLTITRSVPFTQEADYVANDAFPAESHERALDLLTMQTQELNEKVARAAKLPVSSTADADSLVADIVLLADNLTTLETVAGSINDVQAVAAIDDDVAVVAANVADITNFADVYLGPSATDPTLRLDGSALQIGDLYFNTGTSLVRVYSSLGWVDSQTPVPITITRQQFSGDGAETAFTLSSAPAFLNALFVEISGVSQVPSVDYTLSGTTLTFTSAPPLGTDNILARWFSPIAAGVPNDGSVTLAKLSGGFVLPIAQGGTGQATAAAAFTAIKQAASETDSGVVERLTTAEARTGTDTTRYHSAATMKAAQIQNATAVTLTNQTAVDFTGIPSWAKKITVHFVGVSTNGTSSLLVQIGDSGGVELTGYLGSGSTVGDGISPINSAYTTGFGIRQIAAGQVGHGVMALHLVDGTTWVSQAVVSRSDAASVLVSSGSKSLSATLDRVRVTTLNGTDQFDAGTVNISYE